VNDSLHKILVVFSSSSRSINTKNNNNHYQGEVGHNNQPKYNYPNPLISHSNSATQLHQFLLNGLQKVYPQYSSSLDNSLSFKPQPSDKENSNDAPLLLNPNPKPKPVPVPANRDLIPANLTAYLHKSSKKEKVKLQEMQASAKLHQQQSAQMKRKVNDTFIKRTAQQQQKHKVIIENQKEIVVLDEEELTLIPHPPKESLIKEKKIREKPVPKVVIEKNC